MGLVGQTNQPYPIPPQWRITSQTFLRTVTTLAVSPAALLEVSGAIVSVPNVDGLTPY